MSVPVFGNPPRPRQMMIALGMSSGSVELMRTLHTPSSNRTGGGSPPEYWVGGIHMTVCLHLHHRRRARPTHRPRRAHHLYSPQFVPRLHVPQYLRQFFVRKTPKVGLQYPDQSP